MRVERTFSCAILMVLTAACGDSNSQKASETSLQNAPALEVTKETTLQIFKKGFEGATENTALLRSKKGEVVLKVKCKSVKTDDFDCEDEAGNSVQGVGKDPVEAHVSLAGAKNGEVHIFSCAAKKSGVSVALVKPLHACTFSSTETIGKE